MIRTLASLALATGIMVGLTPSQAAAQSPVEVVSIVVNNLVPDGDQLIADATVTMDIVGRLVERDVTFDVALDDIQFSEGDDACPILFLSLGPIDLDLLGLVVELDDCAGDPVTVEIRAVPGEGNLLGNLLCSLVGLLDSPLDLDALLGSLTPGELGELQDVLNAIFAEFLNEAEVVGMQGQGGGPGQGGGSNGQRCDILTLELEEGVFLDLLGLEVETSPICLDIYAERGQGNLLGNLLCALVGLLDGPANLQGLVGNLERILDQLLALGEISPA